MISNLGRALAVLALLWPIAGCAGRPAEHYFQPTTADLGPTLNTFGQAVLPAGGTIVVQGDDIAYGLAQGGKRGDRINGADRGQATITLSETLRHVFRPLKVENRGFPGDTIEKGAERWRRAPPGSLLILSYGVGDAGAHTPLEVFSGALKKMIVEAHAAGAPVFVVIAPSPSDPLQNAELAPYSAAARAVATTEGAEVFEGDAVLARIGAPHLAGSGQTAAFYQGVAADLAPYIRVVRTRS